MEKSRRKRKKEHKKTEKETGVILLYILLYLLYIIVVNPPMLCCWRVISVTFMHCSCFVTASEINYYSNDISGNLRGPIVIILPS